MRHHALELQRRGREVGVAEALGVLRGRDARPRKPRRSHRRPRAGRPSGSRRKPRSTQSSPSRSTRRCAAAEPAARRAHFTPDGERHPEPERGTEPQRAGSPASRCAWCARSSRARYSSIRPTIDADVASRSRSSACNGARAIGVRERRVRVEPGRLAYDSRPRSSSAAMSAADSTIDDRRNCPPQSRERARQAPKFRRLPRNSLVCALPSVRLCVVEFLPDRDVQGLLGFLHEASESDGPDVFTESTVAALYQLIVPDVGAACNTFSGLKLDVPPSARSILSFSEIDCEWCTEDGEPWTDELDAACRQYIEEQDPHPPVPAFMNRAVRRSDLVRKAEYRRQGCGPRRAGVGAEDALCLWLDVPGESFFRRIPVRHRQPERFHRS